MTTPFGRMGGKSRIAKELILYFPPHKIFVEPFVGAGNIFFRKPKAEINIINDLDKDIYTAMKGLQTRSKWINDNINRNVSKKEFQKIKNKNDVLSILEGLKAGFFSNRKTGFLRVSNKTDYTKFKEPLRDVIILNKPFQEVIKNYDSKDTFFYLDPPYENSKDYKTSVEPIDVYNALQGIKGKFMLSYNDSPVIRELFKKYNVFEINTKYSHTQNIKLRNIQELVITNY